jgi:hypothetical protein
MSLNGEIAPEEKIQAVGAYLKMRNKVYPKSRTK